MNKIKVFENKKVRTAWNEETEDWYFSVIDVIEILTESENPRRYWSDLKIKLSTEGSELYDDIVQLKLPAADGKMRLTDVLDTKGILRLVQSVPSPKAEPFKMWLAKVGSERLDEIADPEKAILRGADYYRAKGYTEGWINQRLQTIEMRKELTDEWKKRGLQEGVQFATLTDIIYQTWADMTAREYKQFKGLKKENLRDNMTNKELVLNMLAELSTKEISENRNPETYNEHKQIARQGGEIARNARIELEEKSGKKVISPLNAKDSLMLNKSEENM